jgi:putative two-component system response regulator
MNPTTSAINESAKRSEGLSGAETEGILFALATAIEHRDQNTAGHCERLSFIGVALGMAMDLDEVSLLTLYRGGYLHDVGKVGLPDSILYKTGKLTADEWIVMQSHPERGVEICRHLSSLEPVLPIIRHHHERWDGSGYPYGLAGEEIPLLARVLQIADIYDALTSPRPYKPTYSANEALRIMEEETARGWRDPDLMELFLRMHSDVAAKVTRYSASGGRNLRNIASAVSALEELAS